MAQIKTTAIVADIKGKLNGSVFQGNNGTLSLRQYAVPVNQNSISQNCQRNYISFCQNAWRVLSSSQREEWNNYARVVAKGSKNNSALKINGQALFIKVNVYRLMLKEEVFDVPYGYSQNYISQNWSLTSINGILSLIPSVNVDLSKCTYIIEISGPILPTQNYRSNDTRFVYVSWDDFESFDITSAYTALFGRIPAMNETVFLKSTPVDTSSGLPGIASSFKLLVGGLSLDYDAFASNIIRLYSIKRRLSSYTGPAIRVKSTTVPFPEYDIPFGNDKFIDWAYYNSVGGDSGWRIIKIYDQAGNLDAVPNGVGDSPRENDDKIYFSFGSQMVLGSVSLNGNSPFVVWQVGLSFYNYGQDILGDTLVPSSFLNTDDSGNLVLDTVGGGSLMYEGFVDSSVFMAMVRNKSGNVVSLEDEYFVGVTDVQDVGAWPIQYFGGSASNVNWDFNEFCICNSALTDDQITAIKTYFQP